MADLCTIPQVVYEALRRTEAAELARLPRKRGRESFAKLEEPVRAALEKDLARHLEANPMPLITTMDGTPIQEGTPIEDLVVPGLIADLPIHPDAVVDTEPRKAG